MDLICGLQCLQELAELLQAEHLAEGEGRATRYGKSGIKPPKKFRRGAKQTEKNDGRAPDANQFLSRPKTGNAGVSGADADEEEFDSADDDDDLPDITTETQRQKLKPLKSTKTKRARPGSDIATTTTTTTTKKPKTSSTTTKTKVKAEVVVRAKASLSQQRSRQLMERQGVPILGLQRFSTLPSRSG
ncbi:hypothetical protein CF319_g6206 [Tilletia indica]|nr:hypothetical protein CF319_g6206 [Tilletia indica]